MGEKKTILVLVFAFKYKCIPRDSVRAFWQRAGVEALDHIIKRGNKPVWMSTSGLGVYWLHLR